MKYNTGKKYNFSLNKDGLGYNGIKYVFKVNIFDAINFSDISLKAAAYIALQDKLYIPDFMEHYVLHKFSDKFNVLEKSKNYALFKLAENANVSEPFYRLTTLLYLSDNQKVLDSLSGLNNIISQNEKFDFSEIEDIDTLIKISEKNGYKDAASVFALLKSLDNIAMNDRNPKKAVSDFIIGKADGLDTAYDWIIPFDMKIDWVNSNIQVMPQSQSDYIEQPGVDGSIVENTVYKNRLFSIVAYSEQGMTVYEKEMLKKEIVRVLDSTKNKSKKLTMQAADISFDAKYSGAADISEGPSFVKATIPFEVSPYGYPLFTQEVYGTGLLVNNGVKDIGCVNKISAGAVNPSFQIGSITYVWNGTVPKNSTLVIDHEAYICYLETIQGVRTNALTQLTGDFQKIPKESSVAITAFGNTGKHLYTTLKECYLW